MNSLQLSIEIQPLSTSQFLQALDKFDKVDATLRQNITVFIPHIVTKPYQDVITTVKQLKKEKLKTCPHFAVRNLTMQDDIHDILAEYQQLKIDKLLLVGGDSNKAKYFQSVRKFLESNYQLPCKTIGFGFFPDKHLHCNAAKQLQELKFKTQWAKNNQIKAELYSQICFNPQQYQSYLTTLIQNNINNPIHIGFVAPCKITKLANIARYVGITQAFNFMQKTNIFKLITHFNSKDFIFPLMSAQNLSGYHCYAFGNFTDALKQLHALKNLSTHKK